MENTGVEITSRNGSRVRVIVRVRPLIDEELKESAAARSIIVKVSPDNKHLTLGNGAGFDREFEFDHVAHYGNCTQKSLYEAVGQPLVNDSFQGINGTIIAYGQVCLLCYICARPAQGKHIRFSARDRPWITLMGRSCRQSQDWFPAA